MILGVRFGQGGDRLRRSKDETALVAEGESKGLERGSLHRRVEVDEHVPAQDQIDPRERRASAKVVLAEDH